MLPRDVLIFAAMALLLLIVHIRYAPLLSSFLVVSTLCFAGVLIRLVVRLFFLDLRCVRGLLFTGSLLYDDLPDHVAVQLSWIGGTRADENRLLGDAINEHHLNRQEAELSGTGT